MFSKVLLIAINDYTEYQPLRGCLADAEDIFDTLVSKMGYNPRNIKYLANETATQEAIIRGLEWVSDSDFSFCYYSGHGTLGLDHKPAILTYDYEKNWNNPLSESTIALYIRKLQKGLFIHDCCCSGTLYSRAVRNMFCDRHDATEPEWVERYVPNPLLPDNALADFVGRDLLIRSNLTQDLHISRDSNFIYMSACRNEESAKEMRLEQSRSIRGLFTSSICEILRSNPKVTLKELWKSTSGVVDKEVRKKLASPQHPQLWASEDQLDRTLFG